MGHVPSSPVPLYRQGPHLPRRKHRGSRPTGNPDLDKRISLGAFGELLAARFLTDRGFLILARNVKVGKGEIDLVIRDGGQVKVVEVRTVSRSNYPLEAFDGPKRDQVRSLAGQLRISRCDALGIGLFPSYMIIHWDPDSF